MSKLIIIILSSAFQARSSIYFRICSVSKHLKESAALRRKRKKLSSLLTSIEDIKKVNKKIRQKSWTKTCCAHKNPMSHLAKANFSTIWNRREDGWETFLERKFVFCDVTFGFLESSTIYTNSLLTIHSNSKNRFSPCVTSKWLH